MNARELIQAAKRIKEQTINYPFPIYDFAEYILANVREDDDEKPEPLQAIQTVAVRCTVEVDRFGNITLRDSLYPDSLFHLVWMEKITRGQLRKLLEALGVK